MFKFLPACYTIRKVAQLDGHLQGILKGNTDVSSKKIVISELFFDSEGKKECFNAGLIKVH